MQSTNILYKSNSDATLSAPLQTDSFRQVAGTFRLPLKLSALLFIAGLAVLSALFASVPGASHSGSIEMCIAVVLICILGIPHGSVDNVLFLKQHPEIKPRQFHLKYGLTIVGNLLLWLFFPVMGYLSFMLVSAYHFGESQFSHYAFPKTAGKTIFQFLWGMSILAGMTWYNLPEIQLQMEADSALVAFSTVNNSALVLLVLLVAGGGALAGLVWLVVNRRLNPREFAVELLLLLLIHLGLYTLPLVVGFTLYFITLHSLKVLREEYQFLQQVKMVRNKTGFIKMLTPFSLVSILGIVALFFLARTGVFPASFAYVFLILISCITVPHAYVMHCFYRKKSA